MTQATGRSDVGFRCVRRVLYGLAAGFFRLKVRGLEQIPATGGAIIAGNHPSVLDGILLLAASPRPVRFLVAEDLYTHRYLHPLFTMMGCIPVYRTRTHNGDALRAAVAALESGELLGIFPEGTIHHGGAMQELKRGVALLALKTGFPVVPLAIRGSGEAFPDGARVPHPGTIRLRFERPAHYPKTLTDPIPEEDVRDTLEQIRRSVLAAMRLIPDPARAPAPAGWLKPLQIAVSGLVVLPLAWFLTMTANPSLDPVKQAADARA